MPGTYTPNINLYKPLTNEVGWAALVNSNFDILDTTIKTIEVEMAATIRNSDQSVQITDGLAQSLLNIRGSGNAGPEYVEIWAGKFADPANAALRSASNRLLLIDTTDDSVHFADTVLNCIGGNVTLQSSGTNVLDAGFRTSNCILVAGIHIDTNPPTGQQDTGLYRLSGGLVGIGSGSTGTSNGALQLGNLSQINSTVATNATTLASPTHVFTANYWTGSASAADTWTLQSSLAAGTNGASTLTISHSGSSGAATISTPNNLLVAAGFSYHGFLGIGITPGGTATVYAQSSSSTLRLASAVTLLWANSNDARLGTADTGLSRLGPASIGIGNGTQGDTSGSLSFGNLSQTNSTVATNSTTNASPTHTFSANYWTGAASAADTWTLQSSLAAGTNGASTLTITHSGSSGTAALSTPTLFVTSTLGSSTTGIPSVWCAGSNLNIRLDSVWISLITQSSGNHVNWFSSNTSGLFNLNGFAALTFSPQHFPTGTPDLGISRLGAGSLAIGNGTAGDFTGVLTLGNLNQTNGTVATNITTLSSPTLIFSANYWTGAASAPDTWTLQSSLASGTNGASTLSIGHSGSSGTALVVIGTGAGDFSGTLKCKIVILNNSGTGGQIQFVNGNTSFGVNGSYLRMINAGIGNGFSLDANGNSLVGTFLGFSTNTVTAADGGLSRLGAASLALGNGTVGDFTGALTLGNLTQNNNTVATNVTTNASPTHTFSANYWTGAASAADSWTIQVSLAAGTNGASSLIFGHSGSTGTKALSFPAASFPSGIRIDASGSVILLHTGSNSSFFTHGSGGCQVASIDGYGWAPNNSPGAGANDVALFRLGAASLALGNGASGSFAGSLKLTGLNNQGGAIIARAAKSASYTSTANDFVITFTATATLTLDSAAAVAGTTYRIKLSTAAAGGSVLTISPNNSKTIEGNASQTITILGGSVDVVYDGSTNWEVF